MHAGALPGVSVLTLWGFALLPLTLFVTIAAKSFALFVSIIFSLVITFGIIAVTAWGRRRLQSAGRPA